MRQSEVANANQLIEDQISKIFNENYTNKSPMQMENTVDSYYEQCSVFALENENFSPAELVILSQLNELIKTCKSPKELQVEIEKLKATNKSDTEYTKIMNSIIDENFGSASKTGLTVAGIIKDAMSKYIEKKYPAMSAAEITAIQKKIAKLSFNLEKQSLKINEYTKLNGKTYQKYFSILNKRNIQEGIINDYYTDLEYKDNIDKLSKGIIAVQIGTELYKDIGVNGMDLEDITQDMIVTGGSITAGAAGSALGTAALGLVAPSAALGPAGIAVSLFGCFGGAYAYDNWIHQPVQDKLDETQDWWEEFQWQE